MNTILDEAEARIAPAVATAQTLRQEWIALMREEIGRANYETAKVKLRELEGAIATIYRPFHARVVAIQAQTQAPVRDDMRGWLRDMMDVCARAPQTLRDGIAGWDGLTVPLQLDGRTLDTEVRRKWIYEIRNCLRNWDNQLGHLEVLKALVDRRIAEDEWPQTAA